MQFLVSAGEASGDLYASGVIARLSELFPAVHFYGCAGPRLQAANVKPVIDAASLAVVGLAEVIHHLPRIYGEYRKLIRYTERNLPSAALLTDSPDFNLRLARRLKRLKIPVFYLVAPQVWAWRPGRVKLVRELVDQLFCLFPFEEQWFRQRGVNATYIGHPLAALARTTCSRTSFFGRHRLPEDKRLVVLLPGSRAGEARRHLPILLDSIARLRISLPLSVILATPRGFGTKEAFANFRERIEELSIQVIENQTWDCIGHADVALCASGTVTIEAAILGTPMVTFYKVSPLTWHGGRHLVKVPFFSMVNLIAERQVVPELIQQEMTPHNISVAALELLTDGEKAQCMKTELVRVRQLLTKEGDPLIRAADQIATALGNVQPGQFLSDLIRETISS